MIVELILDAGYKFNAIGAPAAADRHFNLTPAQLYTLCTELQQPLEIISSEYRELANCKRALACKNWEVAAVAMPAELFSMRLKLDI